jgi:hypothetical protein
LILAFAGATYAQTPNVDITAYNPVTVPSGVTFEWHNALPVSSGNLMTVAQTQAATTGLYYAVYNYGSGCYSNPTP